MLPCAAASRRVPSTPPGMPSAGKSDCTDGYGIYRCEGLGFYFDKLSNRFQDSRFRFQVCERPEMDLLDSGGGDCTGCGLIRAVGGMLMSIRVD